MADLLTRQPIKGLYVLFALTVELARLPLWLLKYIHPYGRQHPQWTFRQALGVRVFHALLHHLARMRVKTPLRLSPGAEKERFIVIEPPRSELFVGPLKGDANVKPIAIGASWYPAPLTKSSDTSSLTVILHLHGGAFVLGDGRKEASGYSVSKLLKNTPATHVLAPQYRLSTLPPSPTSNPFPAALQDCLSAYMYLVEELKISPRNIVFSGDSAGGNAAIALLRYIVEYGRELGIPNPGAALLWSPWVEPAESVHEEKLLANRNYGTDYLPHTFTSWGGRAYAGAAGLEILKSPYISMKGKPFKTEVPMWMNTGGLEILCGDDLAWAEGMNKAGSEVEIDVEEKAPHDILLLGDNLGFDAEANACAKRAGEWLKGLRK
jgi:acetyl esterase/lipase